MTADEQIEIRDRRDGKWFWLDDEIITIYGPKIGPYGIALYANLAWRSKYATSKAYPTLSTLAKETGMSRASAYRTTHKLQDVGLISIVNRASRPDSKERDSNLYCLLPIKRGVVPQTTPCSPTDYTGVVPGSTEQESVQQESTATSATTITPTVKPAAAAVSMSRNGKLTDQERAILERLRSHAPDVARNPRVDALVRSLAAHPNAGEVIDAQAAGLKRNRRIDNPGGALIAALERYDFDAPAKPRTKIVPRFES